MKVYPFIFVAILSTFIAFLSTESILYSRNALLAHPEWISGKRLLAAPMMGSREGFYTRNILNQNRLNLHEMHRFNEILLNRVTHVGSIRFRFYLGENSYLNILFNKNKKSFSGIRISQNSMFPSISFSADADGKFLSRESIVGLSLSDRWHYAELIFEPNTLKFIIDGQVVQLFKESSLKQQIIGFRSGNNIAIVDDVEVKDIYGNLVVQETFRNKQGYLGLLFLNFGLIVGIIGIALIAINKKKRDLKLGIFTIILIQLCIIIFLALYYAFDYCLWSRLYHYDDAPKWGQVRIGQEIGRMESYRVDIFTKLLFDPYYTENVNYKPQALIRFLEINPRTEYQKIDLKMIRNDSGSGEIEVIDSNYDAIQTYLKEKPLSSGTRILLLGTSQMWGAGATFRSDRIAVRLQKNLSSYYGKTNNIYIINASKRSSKSTDLLQRYKNHLFLFEPDLVLVNLSNNDQEIDEFRENLYSLIEFNEKNGSNTIFVLEPNNTELDNSSLIMKHNVMSSISNEYSIPRIDLYGDLAGAEVYDSGFLWWDLVHLTSYGQWLAAEFISQGIIENSEFLDNKQKRLH